MSLDRSQLINTARSGLAGLGQGQLGVPLLLLVMLAMMMLPIPAFLLDVFFTFNIALSIVVLLVCVYALRPLDFAVFPTILLVATLMRLALNVASTRVVMLHGQEGHAAAGKVIQAFGEVVIGGNYVVGIVVFAILMIINFVVVTKGAGRTTLNGEGLQHEDGHSHILAGTIPNCRTFDPTYGYELAVIIQDGMKKMTEEQQDVFYYITVMNESYQQPAMPAGVEEGIVKGMYLLEEDTKEAAHHVQLMGSGTILREVREAAIILREQFNIGADVWSVTSFNELRRDGLAVERHNRLHPGQKPQLSYVEECLTGRKGPVIASTDYMKLFAEQIRQWVPVKEFKVLGTDGFGRSDSRKKLRHFFEVDRHFVVLAALEALADRGDIEPKVVAEAIVKFGINPEKRNPLDC